MPNSPPVMNLCLSRQSCDSFTARPSWDHFFMLCENNNLFWRILALARQMLQDRNESCRGSAETKPASASYLFKSASAG